MVWAYMHAWLSFRHAHGLFAVSAVRVCWPSLLQRFTTSIETSSERECGPAHALTNQRCLNQSEPEIAK